LHEAVSIIILAFGQDAVEVEQDVGYHGPGGQLGRVGAGRQRERLAGGQFFRLVRARGVVRSLARQQLTLFVSGY
jgi:hypothetical protein